MKDKDGDTALMKASKKRESAMLWEQAGYVDVEKILTAWPENAEKASGATFGSSRSGAVAAGTTATATAGAADSNSKKNTKIALGVGIGLGFLFLLSVAAYDIAHGATCFGAFPSVAAPTSHPGAAAPVSFVATENSLRGH